MQDFTDASSRTLVRRLSTVQLIAKRFDFIFSDECKEAFGCLKKALTTTPIIEAPDWTAPFELMWDASNYALGVVWLKGLISSRG